jgi:hypothetical protein
MMTRRRVSIVLLLASAAAVSRGESRDRLAKVRLDGTYFSREGRRFIPVGAHWIPAKAGLQWPLEWDPKAIEADFERMRALGFNTVRLDLFWAWFEPRPGDYNPAAFAQLDFLISLAHRYGIYLHPSLFIGGEVGEAYWDVPWRHGRHPHADPEMLRLQTDHAAALARRYRAEPAILAWDLTDEPPYWIVRDQTTDAMAINWTRLIAGAFRRFDPEHPIVVGTDMQDVGHGPFRPDNLRGEVDFFSVHPYPIYNEDLFPDSLLSPRTSHCAAFQTALSGSAGRPVMIQELGASSAQYDPERTAAYDRLGMYSGLAAGANGFLLWCYTDAATPHYRRAPYTRAPHETQFGLITSDGRERPRALQLRSFARIVGRMDLSGVEPAPPDAGILVPYGWSKTWGDFSRFGLTGPAAIPYTSEQDGAAVAGQPPQHAGEWTQALAGAWLSTFISCRRAGLKADFPREQQDWRPRRMLLLPSPLTATSRDLVHVQTPFWDEVRDYVRQGGVLYASLSGDAAIPDMQDLFGARLADRAPASEVTLKVVAPLGDLKPGRRFSYRASGKGSQAWAAILENSGGQVIAVDQDGRPALVAHTYGQGKTLLGAYPIETYLAGAPSAFDGEENTYLIYRALRDWAGLRPLFQTDQPAVEVGALNGSDRGYAVLTNYSPRKTTVRVTTILPLKSARKLTPEGNEPLALEAGGFTVQMEAFGAEVIEWH